MADREKVTEKDKNLKNTPERIIVKANLQNYTFPKETFNERFIGHLIQKNDYDSVIEAASKILSQSWMKKRDNDKINLPPIVSVLSIISILLTIVYMILIYYSTTVENGTALLVVSIVCVVIATLIAFGLSIYNFTRKMGSFQTVQEIIKEDLTKLFEVENARLKGRVEFNFNDEGNYLEIKILQIRPGLENYKEEEILDDNHNFDGVDERQNVSSKNQRQVSQKGSKVYSRQGSKKEEIEMQMLNKQK